MTAHADRARLAALVREHGVVHGKVTLSSGLEADYYVDLRRVTLQHEAAPLIGRQLRALTADWDYACVGGLTLGADPVADAVLHAAAAEPDAPPVDAFVVRKDAKRHGMQRLIEGPDIAGRPVLVVEDTSTTGGSVLTAVHAVRDAGATIVGVCTVVDRATGAREAIEAEGLPYRSLLGLADLQLGVSGAAGDDAPGPSEWTVPGAPVGVGPWDGPWPAGDHYDPELLRDGDRRNVVDAYRYWRRDAVAADLARRAHPFHVAIENLGHDHNIGTVVRTANAFAAEGVHIVGRRRWNRRGAMVTDRYLRLHHHADVTGLAAFAVQHGLSVVAVDNTPGSVPLETAELPRECLLLFGQEGPGLSEQARDLASLSVSIAQFGSTRSINAGVAAGVAMHAWIRQHADLDAAW